MDTAALTGGFEHVPVQSAEAFRAALNAMAHPGQIYDITGATPPMGLSVAAGTLILTLCDPDTPVYLTDALDTALIRDWITFHTGAPLVAPDQPGQAVFAIGAWMDLMPLDRFAIGTAQYPDRSATLIVETPEFQTGGTVLQGPGIKTVASFNVPDITAFQKNAALFPLGCDFYFTSGAQIAAIPRTTQVEAP